MRRALRWLSWLAYWPAPRWLAAIIVAFDALIEVNEASERQRS